MAEISKKRRFKAACSMHSTKKPRNEKYRRGKREASPICRNDYSIVRRSWNSSDDDFGFIDSMEEINSDESIVFFESEQNGGFFGVSTIDSTTKCRNRSGFLR